MKSIKYLFLVLFLSLSVAQAQQYRFKTTGFMVSENKIWRMERLVKIPKIRNGCCFRC